MKILQLVTERQYRGAQVFAAELSNMLVANGHEVYFVGLYIFKENILEVKGANNIDLNGKRSVLDISLLKKLVSLIKKVKPDIVQANGSDTLKYAVLAKYFCPGIKIVYRNISMVSAWSKQGSLKRKLNRFLFSKVSRVTSVGREAMEDLVSTYGFPLERTKVIHRGIPALEYDHQQARQTLANEFRFSASDPVLMHIGQFSPEKNHPFLVEVMEKVIAKNPNARLLFIGEGKRHQEVVNLVQHQQLGNNIFFAGYRKNVQEMLAGADIFVLGSTIEGVPGVILEAGMQKVPAVAVQVGGIGEVVKNEATGILLPAHDVPVFAEAVNRLISEPATRKTFGENAYSFVKNNYSLQRCVQQFEELYSTMLKEK